MKNKQLLIKIEEELYESYKKLCKDKGYNMSQRIRNFIETELKNGTE
jgi:predicted DNA-binding protein